MKKLMMLVVMVAVAVGAQAAAIDWTKATNLTPGGGLVATVANDWTATFKATGNFSVRVTYQGTAKGSGNYSWTSMFHLANNGTWFDIQLNNSAGSYWLWSQDAGDDAHHSTAGGISYNEQVDISYIFTYDQSAKTLNYSVIEGGTETNVATIDNVTFEGDTFTVSHGAQGQLSNVFNGEASYSVQVVPEPTVLALLALSVAGLALKRRVV